jgi:hypothetical protein
MMGTTRNLVGAKLARDEALKNIAQLSLNIFLNKNETGFRGIQQ